MVLQWLMITAIILQSLSSQFKADVIKEAFLNYTNHPEYWQNSFAPVEHVDLSMVGYDDTLESKTVIFNSSSMKILEELQNALSACSTVDLLIHRRGVERDLRLSLTKQERLVSKDFRLKYFSESGSEITEVFGEVLPSFDPTHCYFATTPESIIAASFSLCEGISGYIQFGSEEHILHAVYNDGSAEFYLKSKYQSNSIYDHKSLVEKLRLQDALHNINKRSLVSEYKYSVPLYYEVYFVVDYTATKEGICSSPTLCLKYILNLLNIVSSYYIEFNLHLVLQTVDIWSDSPRLHPNLTHLSAGLDGDNENGYTWFREFLKYQWVNATEMLNSDVRIALLAPSPSEFNTVGRAEFAGLCSDWSSVAVEKLPTLFFTAITMVHELGHNLGASHLENMTEAEWCPAVGGFQDIKDDPCRNATETKYYECIMLGFSNQSKVIQCSICV